MKHGNCNEGAHDETRTCHRPQGHVTGHKKERSGKGANWWYQLPETEAMIKQLEAAWQAKHGQGK